MKPDDIVELPDGRRLMVISPERAAQIYKDVQMWYFRGHTWEKDASPMVYRLSLGILYPRAFILTRAVELAPGKPEYEPCDSPSPS